MSQFSLLFWTLLVFIINLNMNMASRGHDSASSGESDSGEDSSSSVILQTVNHQIQELK